MVFKLYIPKLNGHLPVSSEPSLMSPLKREVLVAHNHRYPDQAACGPSVAGCTTGVQNMNVPRIYLSVPL